MFDLLSLSASDDESEISSSSLRVGDKFALAKLQNVVLDVEVDGNGSRLVLAVTVDSLPPNVVAFWATTL